MHPIFAVTTRGLESVCADEMGEIPGLQVERTAYRRVTASYDGPLAALLALRTVDDVFLHIAEWHPIVPQREALAWLTDQSRRVNLPLRFLAGERAIPQPVRFSVTANFVGKRNYTADEIKQAVAGGIRAHYPWEYAPNDEDSQVNLRVFIEHDLAVVGLRVGARPLHRRAYKQAHLGGSLKPPVAAAMLRMVQLTPGQRLLDPFCGAGTIPIEAALTGARALGGDNDPAALVAARANAGLAGVPAGLHAWDARALPLAAGSVERIAANLPWGRQVPVDARLEDLYRAACAEMQRVLAPGGRIALLTSLPGLATFERLALLSQAEVSVFGQNPQILVFG